MAYKAFTCNADVLWLNEYIERYPDCINEQHDLRDISYIAKGIFIHTDKFKLICYKSHGMYAHLMEFCDSWGASKAPSPALLLKIIAKHPNFELGYDDERLCRLSKAISGTGWHQAYNKVSDNPHSANPLPLPPSTALTTSNAPDASAQGTPQNGARKRPLAGSPRHDDLPG